MEKQIIISEEPISLPRRQGNVLVYLAVVPGNLSQSQIYENESMKDVTSITFQVKIINDLEKSTVEDVIGNSNGVEVLSNYETYQIDLSKMPLPKLVLKDFSNALQMQNFIDASYLQTVLNEGKDYGVNNWVLWKK